MLPRFASPSDPSATLAALVARVDELERQLACVNAPRSRWRWRVAALVGLLALCAAGLASALVPAVSALMPQMHFGTSGPTLPPLDSPLRYSRVDPADLPQGHTVGVLSLLAESTQRNAYTWPLYVQLLGTTHPGASLDSSQSVGATVRAFQRSPGTPWLAGFHSEIFHGLEGLGGKRVPTRGTSILYNGEVTTHSAEAAGAVIGLNLQNTEASEHPGTHAIQIQPGPRGWLNGIHFDRGGAGRVGIHFDQARFDVGIDLGENSLQLRANRKILLDATGQVFVRYNAGTERVEVVRRGRVVAAF